MSDKFAIYSVYRCHHHDDVDAAAAAVLIAIAVSLIARLCCIVYAHCLCALMALVYCRELGSKASLYSPC